MKSSVRITHTPTAAFSRFVFGVPSSRTPDRYKVGVVWEAGSSHGSNERGPTDRKSSRRNIIDSKPWKKSVAKAQKRIDASVIVVGAASGSWLNCIHCPLCTARNTRPVLQRNHCACQTNHQGKAMSKSVGTVRFSRLQRQGSRFSARDGSDIETLIGVQHGTNSPYGHHPSLYILLVL